MYPFCHYFASYGVGVIVDLPQHITTKQSIDQYSRFLEPRLPENQKEYFEKLMPLISKGISIANIKREDMNSYIAVEDVVLESLNEGQIGIARFWMTRWMTELGLTMSFDGLFMDLIATNKFQYTQKQDVYEHIDYPKKKGLLGLGKG
jgi:hypothetical protein